MRSGDLKPEKQTNLGRSHNAGHETKVFMNSTQPPSKRSVIERQVDKIIFFMFFLNFSFCISGCIYFATWLNANFVSHWYLYPEDQATQYKYENEPLVGVCNFVTGFILYGYLIPISLYVSIEMVKITQSMVFMGKDREMYHADTDTPALARTSNLNEDLGMVTTVLSDKTGTLTRNMMDFFKCSIAGTSYGAGVTEIEKSNAERKGITIPPIDIAAAEPFRERFFNFYDKRLMAGSWYSSPDKETIEMFFRLLAVCHTVIPDGPPDAKEIKYEAESPDEAALVVAAKVMGFFCFKRTNTTVVIRESTSSGVNEVEYEVLNVLEFNSTRKRMSVIVRDSNGKLIIFCKGADTVIYERLDPTHPTNQAIKGPTAQHMEDFGSSGLRTLCLSYNELDPAMYKTWQAKWTEAKQLLEGRDEVLDNLMEETEKNLRLLGCSAIEDKLQEGVPQCIKSLANAGIRCTAIEDKLQEGVPRCIKSLADAGIRLWVLTGDKLETAVNIGFACSLITEEMQQFIITAYFKESMVMVTYASVCQALETAVNIGFACSLITEVLQQFIITAYFKEVDDMEAAGDIEGAAKLACSRVEEQLGQVAAAIEVSSHMYDFALVIDGKALSYALGVALEDKFLAVGIKCKAVLCCRVSPLQKAMVTRLVKVKGENVTLAIGDGANDVGMIQEAHIGVGISGQEGIQAVMASDFAIAQFRSLTSPPSLLLYSGVGISGQEGMQAVMASDFAIAQFRFLTSLLLVHGRLSYKRITRMVAFFFYKNLLFGITLFAFNAFTTFSGQYVYNDVYMTLYNVVFTSVTPIVIGMFDRDLDRDISLKFPQLYRQGQANTYLNFWAIAAWLSTAIFQCCVVFAIVMIGSLPTLIDRSAGNPMTMYQTGITLYSIIIITVHLEVISIEEQWTWLHHASIWGSQEYQYLEKKRAAAGEPPVNPEDPAKTAGQAVKIFSKQNTNAGFVPPYDPKSRFYSFIKKGASSSSKAPPVRRGRSDVVANPVLTHLDNELTNNPNRSQRAHNGSSSSSALRSTANLSSPTGNGEAVMYTNPLSVHDDEMISTYTAALK
eukprot:gene23701-9242_t